MIVRVAYKEQTEIATIDIISYCRNQFVKFDLFVVGFDFSRVCPSLISSSDERQTGNKKRSEEREEHKLSYPINAAAVRLDSK